MRSSLKLLALGAMLALAAADSTGALAADKEQVIKDRQALMKDQIREWIAVRNYVEGKADQAAAIICLWTLAKSVPDGAEIIFRRERRGQPRRQVGAKPEFGANTKNSSAANKKVGEQVAALVRRSGVATRPKVEAAFKDLGNTCNGCHDTFRAKLAVKGPHRRHHCC